MEKDKSAYIDFDKIMNEGKITLVRGATAKGRQELLKALILKSIKEGCGVLIVDEFSVEN